MKSFITTLYRFVLNLLDLLDELFELYVFNVFFATLAHTAWYHLVCTLTASVAIEWANTCTGTIAVFYGSISLTR